MSRIRADRLTNKEGTGAPLFPNGISVVGLTSISNIVANTGTFNGNVSIGGTLTYEDVTNIDSVGVITARTGIKVTAGGINAVGVVTATSFVGDGSGLTNAGPSLTGSTNNTIVTVTGANALAGEPKFTYDGTNLKLQQTVSGGYNEFIQDANPSSENATLGYLSGYWNTERVADIRFAAGDDTSNKNNAHIVFRTTNEGQGNITDRLRIGNFGQIGLPVGGVGVAATDWGASGQVLTSGGSSASPQWASVSATPVRDAWWSTSNSNNFFWNVSTWGGSGSTLARRSGFPTVSGQQMTHSSGVWTFPSTGVWEIRWYFNLYSGANNSFSIGGYTSTDSGSSWDGGAELMGSTWWANWTGNYNGDNSSGVFGATTNVTNATTHRIKLLGMGSGGGSTQMRKGTWVMFTKLT